MLFGTIHHRPFKNPKMLGFEATLQRFFPLSYTLAKQDKKHTSPHPDIVLHLDMVPTKWLPLEFQQH
jgi:hypothetical protein